MAALHRTCPPPPARVATAALVALALLAGACSDDARPAEEGTPTTGATVAVAPAELRDHAEDWPAPGRDHANTRAVPGSAITTATVDELVELWRAELPGPGVIGNAATTPLILGDRVLVQDLGSNVRSFDLGDGHLVWEATVELPNLGPNGVAVADGRVVATRGTQAVMALDADTGEELWVTELTTTPTSGIDIQPQVAAGLVLVSTVPVSLGEQYAGGDRGVLHALDLATGEVVWTFDTVADDDLWGDPEVNSGGGAWYPPAVDDASGTVYWGIGNPAPFPGTAEHPNGTSRPGPNLYTDSVVALDVRTGELRWYHQVFEHDLFDRDHVHTLLAEGPDGPVLVSTGKGGVVVGHDPATGDARWRTPVGVHDGDDATALDGPTEIWPGTFGGVLTPPSTADGVVYVATLNAPTELRPDEPAYIGSELGTAPGEVVAVDAGDGSILWATEVDGDPLGGTTVVGDLVLTATYQGTFLALDRTTGELVWQLEAPGGVNGWPAVAGDRIVWPVGLASPAVLVALGLPG